MIKGKELVPLPEYNIFRMKNQNLGILILRLSIGVMMLLHGIAKVTNSVETIKTMLTEKGLSAFSFVAYGVYVGEILAPLLIIIGYRTRLASLVLVATCCTIIWLGNYDIFSLGKYGAWGAELPGLFLFGALALFFTGAGKYALSTKNTWD